MEIKIKIDAPGLEGAIHTLAQVLANYEMPVQIDGKEVSEKIEAKTKETTKQDDAPSAEETEAPKKDEPKQEEEPESEETAGISLETVRGKLAELAQSGKQKEVKALITEMGAKKLTDVPAEKYPELLEKAEGLL